MTDREQTRRDAEGMAYTLRTYLKQPEMADLTAALLAELEQAGRELDGAEGRERTWQGRATVAEARLAKVPALVKALRGIPMPSTNDAGIYWDAWEAASAAVAAWEQGESGSES